ncbi:DNA helicase RecQ [Rhodocytophaga rosea]|uniref:DNA helicase RecQ n=1 Tax=Rhodocytophaga rosea TaxID=2704465 RepID=A0A6C0GR29_9BACT|nr:DNA helicase RecQ [Rhodocytophaga rosea]QHT70528.1 DNA helicase RecQ [Rhodocytophaga rosea]
MPSSVLTPESVLKQYFGYDTYRPMQQEIIYELLQGKDVLVLMPTGGGKSICYQVPAMVMPGITIVVSPLIALMKDQVESLLSNGIPAAYLNSSQSGQQQSDIENECLQGVIKLLYISPEKLLSQGFQALLKKLPIDLFAIDEAHCISGWGHDFRPEYTQLNLLKQNFPGIPVVALTATADKLIRQDIVEQLGLQAAKVFVSSFDRKNLSLTVLPGRNKLTQVMDFLDAHKGQAGIIYCLSRSNTEQVAEKLTGSGYKAGYYHAGMSSRDRSKVQEAFLKDDIQVICATIAFGMGIDKSNVRWVIHFNLPKNMESYYQEIGRAGRDGLPAATVLFYSFRDVIAWREILNSKPEDEKRVELQMARLERMQQYAEAYLCRRRILLNYFSEQLTQDCQNCDICKNPRSRFDGTILAQKALSAVIRLQESVTMGMLIDVLRGSRSAQIVEKGYDKIKTYGAGADLKTNEWRDYLQQMVNTGILEVAYHQKYALHRGVLSQRILNGSQQVWLVKSEPIGIPKQNEVISKQSAASVKEHLLDKLKIIRKRLADSQNVPPYIVFNDHTLSEMVMKRPKNREQLLRISGIGQHKLDMYGDAFLIEINKFPPLQRLKNEPKKKPAKEKIDTYQLTYDAFIKGYHLEEIAKQRELSITTIQTHIITLWMKDYPIDIYSFISAQELQILCEAIPKINGLETKSKELFDYFREKYDYFKIKIALSVYAKKLK